MKKRILFVDDEPMILRGMERGMRSMREQWQVEFAGGGVQALDAMEKEAFDVVITDMRMPGMDGAELLSQVRERFPSTVRMVLSGQSDQDTIFRAMNSTHQYLSKPCDVEEVKRKLIQVLSFQDMLVNTRLKEAVSRMETVPSDPGNFDALQTLMKSESPSISAAADIIGRDMGMTLKVLQILNSSFLGTGLPVADIRRAVSALGINQIKTLVASVHLFSRFEGELRPDIIWIWKESYATAMLSQAIAKTQVADDEMPSLAFTAGLLHDVGRLVLAAISPGDYGVILRNAAENFISAEKSENEILGCTHAQVGGYLLGLWGLPDAVVQAVAWHHHPAQGNPQGFCPLIAVHVADVQEFHLQAQSPPLASSPLDEKLLANLGLTERIPVWQKACQLAQIGGGGHG